MTSTATTTPSRGRLVLILGTLTAIGPLSIDLYLPSFPAVAKSLGVDVAAVQLTLATYLAGLAVGQIVYGPLSDRMGRRAPLVAGLALYIVASVACAFAPSLPFLAAARFVKALGGCSGMVIARAIVRDHFDERDSASLYSTLMLVMGAAPILAPSIGGQLLLVGSWRTLFGVLAVIGTVFLGIATFLLPESLAVEARTRHGPGQILRSVGVMLKNSHFRRMSLAGGAAGAAMFAYISGSPFVFIELFHVTPQQYGLIFGMNAMGLIIASQLNRWLVHRSGVVTVLRAAITVAVLANAVLWAAIRAGAGLEVILPALFFGIACVGLINPNSTAAAMAPFGRQAGVASALFGTLISTLSAAASVAVSAFANGTAMPMATVMVCCSLLALILVMLERFAPGAAVEGAGAR
ncbi:MAG: multidrug effflux MFS transporter [Myxococcaceae bacterium]